MEFEVIFFPTSTETKMLKRCQLSVLRIIMGLPARAATIAIHHLAGTLPFKFLVYKSHLSFLHCILSLPDAAVSRAVFLMTHPSEGYTATEFLIS